MAKVNNVAIFLTVIFNVIFPVKCAHCYINKCPIRIHCAIKEGSGAAFKSRIAWGPLQAFIPQVAHEELQTN